VKLKTKEKLRDLTVKLALNLRGEIFKVWGEIGLRNICGTAASGDVTFKIDEIAERCLEKFFKKADLPIAYFSEDRGLINPNDDSEFILIVDPIDGTRAAIAGLETCCVSVAVAPFSEDVKLCDVFSATLVEIKSGSVLSGVIGEGVKYYAPDGKVKDAFPSNKKELKGMLWAFEIAGRPANAVISALDDLIDRTSLQGGCFIFNSASFALSRVALGQLDAYIDIMGEILKKTPGLARRIKTTFEGKMGMLHFYDVAAAIPLVQTAGCTVTDADGNSLDNWSLFEKGDRTFKSCICSSNERLHQNILQYFRGKGF